MFDERLGEESDKIDNELEQYLSLFKITSESKAKQTIKKASSSKGCVKTSVHQKRLPQLKPSYSLENEMESPSDELLTSLQQNLKIHNLQELSDTFSMQPDDNTTRLSEDTGSGMDDVVLALKDLTPSETSLCKNKTITEDDASLESFYIKANIFTIDDLVVSGRSDNVTSAGREVIDKSVDRSTVSEGLLEDGVKSNTEHHGEPMYRDDFEDTTTCKDDIEGTMYKDDFEDTTTRKGDFEKTEYKDDFEGEDSQNNGESSDESVVECIEEGQFLNETASFAKGNTDSNGSDDSESALLSSSRSNSDTKQNSINTDDTNEVSQATQHSESSVAGDVLKTEVCEVL